MSDDETLTMRATAIGGFRCADDYQAMWPGKERGRHLRYSKLVRSDQPNCGNLADVNFEP
ncbi:hypothetical protein SAMN05443247_11879 [Bradyrhizobium erythrophlei]|nr:hypothetical protein SAMN05443247_11879 [Bradyrhizobium erythrophlei]